MIDANAPIAVPQSQQSPQSPQSGTNAPPQQTVSVDPSLDGFAKIAAERRSRQAAAPQVIPFGSGTIRIHSHMPAGFAFDGAAAEVDPYAAKRALRSAIVPDDQERFDAVFALSPDNPEGIDGEYLLKLLEELARFYSGVPLGG